MVIFCILLSHYGSVQSLFYHVKFGNASLNECISNPLYFPGNILHFSRSRQRTNTFRENSGWRMAGQNGKRRWPLRTEGKMFQGKLKKNRWRRPCPETDTVLIMVLQSASRAFKNVSIEMTTQICHTGHISIIIAII